MKDLLSGPETLEGTVKRITYQNEENGYTIAALQAEDRRDPVPIVGTMPGLTQGENVRVTGKWNRHEKFGLQLQVESYERVLPVTLEGIEKFLASGAIKGLGPVTAKKIVKQFGIETMLVLERTPERLQEIEGIGSRKTEQIARSMQEHRGVQSVMVYLGTRGVAPALAEKIFKKYGADAITVLEENPYRLVDEVKGIGFKTADKLAQQLGVSPLAPSRLKIGLKHVLSLAADEGHVFLPESELLAKSAQLLGAEAAEYLPEQLARLTEERTGGVLFETYGQERLVYLAGFYFAEVKVAEKIRLLLAEELTPSVDDVDALLEEVEQEEGLSLAPLQRQAVKAVLTKRLVVVTGGPGTGKTTTVKAMIAALKKDGITPILAAPTGRAAKRMTESTGVEAKTLHRLLEYGNTEGEGLKFQRNEENRLEGKVFIIDEASMIDLLLFFQLLRALPDQARLVLCGDIDQLPSVGAGRVLQDLIDSGVVDVVRLLTIFRQAQESLIVKNAHRINQGEMPVMQRDGDFFFIEEGDPDALANLVLDLASRRLPGFIKGDPVEDIQILVPMRKGSVGVDSLNEQLQWVLNPPLKEKREMTRPGGRILRVCDKVMQIKNNYQKEVYNGDVGRILDIDPEEGEVTVEYRDATEPRTVTYAAGEVDELTLAYAVSVHKSQGSEYPCVILPVVMQHRVMLQRNLLYTGVTRAKRLVVLVGSRDALRVAIRSGDRQKRYSLLQARLRGLTN